MDGSVMSAVETFSIFLFMIARSSKQQGPSSKDLEEWD